MLKASRESLRVNGDLYKGWSLFSLGVKGWETKSALKAWVGVEGLNICQNIIKMTILLHFHILDHRFAYFMC